MTLKPWTTIAVLVLGFSSSAAAQADSGISSLDFPFHDTDIARVGAYELLDQNAARTDDWIKYFTCQNGACKIAIVDDPLFSLSAAGRPYGASAPEFGSALRQTSPYVRDIYRVLINRAEPR